MATWQLPARGRLTSPFGPRVLEGAIGSFHFGVDIGAKRRKVRAAQDGIVRTIWQTPAGAWVVDLRHPDEGGHQVRTRYIHMFRDEITVEVGDQVQAGQKIGRSGASGTTAAHLHFEVLVDGTCSDPVSEMARRAVQLGDTTPGADEIVPLGLLDDDPDPTLLEEMEAQMIEIVLDRITNVRTAQAAHTTTLAVLAERLTAVRITAAAHTQTLAVIKAAVTGSPAPVVDEAAIAHEIAVELAPALMAAALAVLPVEAGTAEERRTMVEGAVRDVLASLEEQG